MKRFNLFSEKFIKRGIAVVLTAAFLGAVFGKSVRTEAIFDPDKAITYQDFAARVTVEDSVLFIGTYIVHKDALTDDIYEKAVDSASDSGQSNVYYKSELADGQWFETDIIDNGVRGISVDGIPESIENINPLYVTYYVGSDGILKDAKTLASMNPFDIPDPYDLSSLPELDPIRTQYTMSEASTSISQEDFLSNKNSSDSGNLRSDVYYYQLLSTFFSLDLRDAETDKCDEQLRNLNDTYIALKAAGSDEEAELVYDLMSKVDAKRRLLIMERLSEMDDNLLSKLNELCTGSFYTPYGNFKDSSDDKNRASQPDFNIELEDSTKHNFDEPVTNPFVANFFSRLGITSSSSGWWTVLEDYEQDKKKRAEEANSENEDYVADAASNEYPFKEDSALVDAIGTSMGNCSDSYNTYRAKALVDSDDLLAHIIYDYSTEIIEQTSGGTLGGPISYLKHATNIQENKISDKDGELSLLKTLLLTMGIDRYTSAATAGAGAEYQSASSEGARKTALESQKTDAEAHRAMLQFLIEAMRQRDTAPNALEYVNERIVITEQLLEDIPDDAYKTYATSSVQAHLVWLKEEAQKIIDSDESLKSKLDQLRDKKKELQEKRDNCLDNNDLSGAARYDALIAAVDQDIDREASAGGWGEGSGDGSGDGSGFGGAGSGGSGSGGSGSGGSGSGGSGSGSGQDKMADSLVDKALSKLADDASADLSGIASALAGLGEEDKLNALADKAAASGASASTMAGIKDAQNSLKDSKTSPDSDALLAKLEELFGKSLGEMDDNELAVAGATMSRLSRMGITPAESLTKKIVNMMRDKKNKFLYVQYAQNKSTEYINMDTISNCTDFRYFYDDNKATATMTKGAIIYIFKRGTDKMYKQSFSSEGEPLTEKIVYSGVVYLAEKDAMTYFDCDAEYAYGTEYAICLTPPKQTAVEEYTKEIEEFFKE